MSPWASGDSLTPSTLNLKVPSWWSSQITTTLRDFPASLYGAVADGTTDDASAIMAAVNAAAVTGGRVTLSAGTHLIGSTITIPADVVIVGQGPNATTLRYSGSGVAIDTSATSFNYRFGLRDFRLMLGTRGATGVRVRSAAWWECANVHFRTPPSSIVTDLRFMVLDASYATYNSQYHFVVYSRIVNNSFRGNDPGSLTPGDYRNNVGIVLTGGITGTVSAVHGSFQTDEVVTGTYSNASGVLQAFDASTAHIRYTGLNYVFARGDVITGSSSGATAALTMSQADPWYNCPRTGMAEANEFSDLATPIRVMGAENFVFRDSWSEECYGPGMFHYGKTCRLDNNRFTNDSHSLVQLVANTVVSGFSLDDVVTGATSGATGRVAMWDGTFGIALLYGSSGAVFQSSETVTGATGGAMSLNGTAALAVSGAVAVGVYLHGDARNTKVVQGMFNSETQTVFGAANTTEWLGTERAHGGVVSNLPYEATQLGGYGAERRLYTGYVRGDTEPRFAVQYDSEMLWGSGATTPDVSLSRLSANYGAMAAGDFFQANLVSSSTTAQSGATAKIPYQGQLYFSVLSLTSNGGEFGFRSGNTVYRFASVAVG